MAGCLKDVETNHITSTALDAEKSRSLFCKFWGGASEFSRYNHRLKGVTIE